MKDLKQFVLVDGVECIAIVNVHRIHILPAQSRIFIRSHDQEALEGSHGVPVFAKALLSFRQDVKVFSISAHCHSQQPCPDIVDLHLLGLFACKK